MRYVSAKIRTAISLGIGNVARVAAYRAGLKARVHPVRWVSAAPVTGPFFRPVNPSEAARTRSIAPIGRVFGWLDIDTDHAPDWHRNVLTGARPAVIEAPWWTLPDFDATLGDVKSIWELSRFDWALHFAQHALRDGDSARRTLDAWLGDWLEHNPPYSGRNWKCGQEASIRVLHLALAARMLGQVTDPEPALVDLVALHARRISPTMAYAVGQANNHGTSEAAALFVAGSWLEKLGVPKAAAWTRKGRRWLTERARRLIEPDGTFSQYSVNYHRLMLDTYGVAELWRREMGAPAFDDGLYDRMRRAAEWLRLMTDESNGDAPNIGANDGANLLALTEADTRDFRPSVQLASALFADSTAYSQSELADDHLSWLGVDRRVRSASPAKSSQLDHGGFAVLIAPPAKAVLRYPRFRFRPSHADALHVDLWVHGVNLLRDAGTFSYAIDLEAQAGFAGVAGHTTIQFDEHDQMPRIGRFLWADWSRTRSVEPVHESNAAVRAAASYQDSWGASHTRRLELRRGSLRVQDTVAGFHNKAVIRWRLHPSAWRAVARGVTDGVNRIVVHGDGAIARVGLTSGWESRYYLRRDAVPVLEVEVHAPGTIITDYHWTE